MPTGTLLLVLVSAFFHALWNALLKRSRDPEHAMGGMMLAGAVIGIGAAAVLGASAPTMAGASWSVASGMLEAGYFLALARALARAPLSTVYTVSRGGALLVVWPTSVLLLGETITESKVAGTVLVGLGLAATGLGGRGRRGAATDDEGARRSGVVYALVAALFIGGFNLSYKRALMAHTAAPTVNAISLTVGSALNFAMLGPKRRAAIEAARAEPLRSLVGGLLATGGFLLFLTAMKDSGAGVVLTLRNTSILFALFLSMLMGEKPTRTSAFGAVLVTIGAVLLAR